MENLNGKEHHEEDELTEAERWEIERKMMETAYENSYKILTKKCSFRELVESTSKKASGAILAHDPQEGFNEREMEVIIRFFEEREEYEKCAELKPLLDEF